MGCWCQTSSCCRPCTTCPTDWGWGETSVPTGRLDHSYRSSSPNQSLDIPQKLQRTLLSLEPIVCKILSMQRTKSRNVTWFMMPTVRSPADDGDWHNFLLRPQFPDRGCDNCSINGNRRFNDYEGYDCGWVWLSLLPSGREECECILEMHCSSPQTMVIKWSLVNADPFWNLKRGPCMLPLRVS